MKIYQASSGEIEPVEIGISDRPVSIMLSNGSIFRLKESGGSLELNLQDGALSIMPAYSNVVYLKESTK